MDLWERGLRTVMVGDAEAEGAAREGISTSGGEEDDRSMSRKFHSTIISRDIWKSVRWASNREGGRVTPSRISLN